MQPLFRPQLGSRTVVPVSSTEAASPLSAPASTTIVFRAHLSAEDYDANIRTGARLELWSDLPAVGKSEGEWAATEFVEVVRPARVAADSAGGRVLSLVNDADASDEDRRVFEAVLSIPSVQQAYTFTYRMVYPYGVEWLGSTWNNGVVEVAYEEPGFTFSQQDGWVIDEGTESRAVFLSSEEEDLVVGRVRTGSWMGWALHDSSDLTDIEIPSPVQSQRASLMMLLPRLPNNAIHQPTPLLFSTSNDASFSLLPSGELLLHGHENTRLEIRLFDASAETDSRFLINHINSLPKAKVLTAMSKQHVIISPEYDPFKASLFKILPITSSPLASPSATTHYAVDLRESFSPTSSISVYDPATHKAVFITKDDKEDRDESPLTIVAGPRGGRFVVSPAYNIDHTYIAFASLSALPFSLHLERSNILPTPPASPPPTSPNATRVTHSIVKQVAFGAITSEPPHDAASQSATSSLFADASTGQARPKPLRQHSLQYRAPETPGPSSAALVMPSIRQVMEMQPSSQRFITFALTVLQSILNLIFFRLIGMLLPAGPPGRFAVLDAPEGKDRNGFGAVGRADLSSPSATPPAEVLEPVGQNSKANPKRQGPAISQPVCAPTASDVKTAPRSAIANPKDPHTQPHVRALKWLITPERGVLPFVTWNSDTTAKRTLQVSIDGREVGLERIDVGDTVSVYETFREEGLAGIVEARLV